MMSDVKKVGRPRHFDEDDALDKAMAIFWEKGYDGASMKDLTVAMGINSPSLYSSFGDKRQLFFKAIKNYIEKYARTPIHAFEKEADIEDAVRAFKEANIDLVTANGTKSCGCFIASSAVTSSCEIEGVEQLLFDVMENTQQELAERFDLEKKKGKLSNSFPSLDRAKLMFDQSVGSAFRARAGVVRQNLLLDVEPQIHSILN